MKRNGIHDNPRQEGLQLKDLILRQELGKAFSGCLYPGDDNLLYPDAERHPEQPELLHVLTGRKRQDFGIVDVMLISYALSFLSEAAFRYYAAAFLSAVIENYPLSKELTSSLLFHLIFTENPDRRGLFLAVMRNLLPKELASMIRCLRRIKEQFPAESDFGDVHAATRRLEDTLVGASQ